MYYGECNHVAEALDEVLNLVRRVFQQEDKMFKSVNIRLRHHPLPCSKCSHSGNCTCDEMKKYVEEQKFVTDESVFVEVNGRGWDELLPSIISCIVICCALICLTIIGCLCANNGAMNKENSRCSFSSAEMTFRAQCK